MPRPHAAALVEDALNRRLASLLDRRGWAHRIQPFIGYGSPMFVRVLARVVLTRDTPSGDDPRESPGQSIDEPVATPLFDAERDNRGWRSFITAPVVDVPVTVHVGDQRVRVRTDRSGLLDVTVRGHGLAPGWHALRIESPRAQPAQADVLVIGSTVTFGVVSDIDDTVLATWLPRPSVAAWNTFVRTEDARRAVPGMATFYREIRAANPQAPFFYLSTGAWNTMPQLARFMRRHGFPTGPMLLTDWGPTTTSWFRSGQQHKQGSLHRLARDYPQITWLLVGDDGQHDPRLYADFARAKPSSVAAIAIRELTAGEQVLAHGLPVANDQLVPPPTEELTVPLVRAPDGYSLARQLRALLDTVSKRRSPNAVTEVTGATEATGSGDV